MRIYAAMLGILVLIVASSVRAYEPDAAQEAQDEVEHGQEGENQTIEEVMRRLLDGNGKSQRDSESGTANQPSRPQKIVPLDELRGPHTALYGLYLPKPLHRRDFEELTANLNMGAEVPQAHLDLIWQYYVTTMNEVLKECYPPVYEVSAFLAENGMERNRTEAARAEELVEKTKEARQSVKRIEGLLFNMLASLADGQFADEMYRYRLLRRWQRNMTMTLWPELPGSRIHISRVMKDLKINWPDVDLRSAYEQEIASAAERYATHRIDTMDETTKWQATRVYDENNQRYEFGSPASIEASLQYMRKTKGVRARRLRQQRRLYDTNTRYLQVLARKLDAQDARRLTEAFHEIAFPSLYPNEYDLNRWLQQFDQPGHSPLPAETHKKVRAIVDEFQEVMQYTEQSIRAAKLKKDEHFVEVRALDEKAHELDEELKNRLEKRLETAKMYAMRIADETKEMPGHDRVCDSLEKFLDIELAH